MTDRSNPARNLALVNLMGGAPRPNGRSEGLLPQERMVTFEEALGIADRMGDLIDTVVSLQPAEIAVLGGLCEGLWNGDSRERQLFLSNLRAIVDAVA